MGIITSFSNPLVKRFKKLHRSRGRIATGQTIIEGPTTLALAMDAGVMPRALLVLEDDDTTQDLFSDRDNLLTVVSRDVMTAAADTVQPLGPIALIDIPPYQPIRTRNTLVLRDIHDPGNVGTMIRSAAAFGWDICVSGDTADPWSPKVIRAGAGSHFSLHLSRSATPHDDASMVGLRVVASVAASGGEPSDQMTPVALLIGSEAHGLSQDDITSAEATVSLSMPGPAESLNAAIAASLLMYVISE